jgi:tripartite-type tricarboxylate transporter receptor subunit TctC
MMADGGAGRAAAAEVNMKKIARLLVAVVTIGVFVGAATAQEDFYRGKTVRFVVGFSPGGGFDSYTRVIARHMGKHIPGNPTMVVENMPGAGSMIAANYTYNQAKPDGLTIGNFIGPVVLQQVLGNTAAKFDGRRFGWLGNPVPSHSVCALSKQSGITTVNEWFASKRPVKIGGTGPGSDTVDVVKILQAATGLPIQLIAGYKGTSDVRLAVETGEVDAMCTDWHSIKATWTKALEQGTVRVVIQETNQSHPDLKGVPLAIDYVKTDKQRKLLEVSADAYGTLRPYALPPETPEDRLRILQAAFIKTARDPDLLAEAKQARLDFDPTDGTAVAKVMASFYELEASIIAQLKTVLLGGK